MENKETSPVTTPATTSPAIELTKSEATPVAAPAVVPTTPSPNALRPEISIDDFFKIDLRIGKILSAEPLPKSNKLLKLKVDLGTELGERQVLSGIAKFYTPDQLVGKNIIVIANLKPAQMMGEASQGMLLAADGPDGAPILLQTEKETSLGARIR